MTNQEKKEFAKQFKNLMQSLDATYTEPVKSIWLSLKRKAVEDLIGFLEEDSVLDKIRDEIETKYGQCDICEYFEDYDYEENDISEYRPIGNVADILQIIDKYKAESEDK